VTIRSHKLPIVRGFLMYLTAVIQTIILNFDPAQMHVETESETWDLPTLMLTLCNGPREGGGFLVAPDARLDDGILHYGSAVGYHYATIRKVSRPMMFRLIPEVMKGTHGRFKPVRMGTCRKMSMTSDRPLYIHADGEIYTGFGSNVRRLSIEVVPNALKIVR
jgi:diacylglycerol kinase family enzyme